VVGVYDDIGISGATRGVARPAMRRLLAAITRREIDLVAAWSVDRLGRSLIDVVGFLGELHAKGIDLYLHQQGVDTSTPAGRALFQMLGVFAEFERAIIRERIAAGLARARSSGRSRAGDRPPASRCCQARACQAVAGGRLLQSRGRPHGRTVRRLRAS
jgi:DNA invertase Pin-like site-specific DNA recombinase